jgi:hypothetical protein
MISCGPSEVGGRESPRQREPQSTEERHVSEEPKGLWLHQVQMTGLGSAEETERESGSDHAVPLWLCQGV